MLQNILGGVCIGHGKTSSARETHTRLMGHEAREGEKRALSKSWDPRRTHPATSIFLINSVARRSREGSFKTTTGTPPTRHTREGAVNVVRHISSARCLPSLQLTPKPRTRKHVPRKKTSAYLNRAPQIIFLLCPPRIM